MILHTFKTMAVIGFGSLLFSSSSCQGEQIEGGAHNGIHDTLPANSGAFQLSSTTIAYHSGNSQTDYLEKIPYDVEGVFYFDVNQDSIQDFKIKVSTEGYTDKKYLEIEGLDNNTFIANHGSNPSNRIYSVIFGDCFVNAFKQKDYIYHEISAKNNFLIPLNTPEYIGFFMEKENDDHNDDHYYGYFLIEKTATDLFIYEIAYESDEGQKIFPC